MRQENRERKLNIEDYINGNKRWKSGKMII